MTTISKELICYHDKGVGKQGFPDVVDGKEVLVTLYDSEKLVLDFDALGGVNVSYVCSLNRDCDVNSDAANNLLGLKNAFVYAYLNNMCTVNHAEPEANYSLGINDRLASSETANVIATDTAMLQPEQTLI